MQPNRNEPPQDIDEAAERARAQREVDQDAAGDPNAVVADDAAGDSENVSHP